MPSARRVTINNINTDIVIPNLNTLSNFPDKAIVIQIPKDARSLTKQMEKNFATFQPNIRF